MQKNYAFVLILFVVLFTSCKTYIIPLESFREQFEGIDSTKLIEVEVGGSYMWAVKYLANPIVTIKCIDKKGKPAELKNSPSIEIRFTHGEHHKRTIYYFDRIYVADSSVVGVQSRIISAIRKTIPLNSITKIEVQDGGKNYYYIKRKR